MKALTLIFVLLLPVLGFANIQRMQTVNSELESYRHELNMVFPDQKIKFRSTAFSDQVEAEAVYNQLETLEKILWNELEDKPDHNLIHLSCRSLACCGGPCGPTRLQQELPDGIGDILNDDSLRPLEGVIQPAATTVRQQGLNLN